MSDIRLYISTHKENVRIPKNSLIIPVQVGTALRDKRFSDMSHDDDGINISKKNKSYCELTAQYWAWKNISADYYGFFHYRRYLSFAEEKFPTVHEPFIFDEVVFPENTDMYLEKICFNENRMREIIESHDFVAPCASVSLKGESVYEQYANSAGHHIEDLESVMSIIRRKSPEIVDAMDKYLMGRKMYCCNMYIMRKDIFMKYSQWLFDVLEEFESHRDLTQYQVVDGRVTGYLAERLCGVYLTYLFESNYNGIELQKVFFRETDPTVLTPKNEKNSTGKNELKPIKIVKKIETKGKSFAKKEAGNIYRSLKTRLGTVPVYSRHREDLPDLEIPDIRILRAIPDVDGRIILQFSVIEMSEISRQNESKYEVKIHDGTGNNVLYSALIELCDKIKKNERFNEFEVRITCYSCKINGLPDRIFVELKRDSVSCEKIITKAEICSAVKLWKNISKSSSQYDDYNNWYLMEHRVKPNELKYQKQHKFEIEPFFSIIVPLYYTPEEYFDEMVCSVLNQTYGRFELILVNASPDDIKLAEIVNDYVKKDCRIRITELEKNLGITENTNVGISMARGDFICFLDHDDVLEADALYEYARAVNDNPKTDLIYCDEDKKLGEVFTDPYFKPDYNPDLLMGVNYVCHFLAVRKFIVDSLSPASSQYDGAQDYNMTFQIAEKARYINHVSRILYHWRIHENSTAYDPEQKSYTLEAARLCVEKHLERTGIKGRVINSLRVPRHYEVLYELPENKPLVSIIIPSKNSRKLIERCISSIFTRTFYDNYEIIIVDNGSTDEDITPYYNELTKKNNIKIVHFNEKFNFAKQINLGFSNSEGEYLIFLNNDTEVITNDWIERLLGPLMRSDVGAVGARLLFPDCTVQHAGIVMNENGPMHLNQHLPRFAAGYYDTSRLSMDVTAVTAACMMTRRSLFESVGGFEEKLEVNYNDVDYCLKLRKAGYLIVYEAGAELYHYESATRDEMVAGVNNDSDYINAQGLLMQKWKSYYIEGDPNYNKNFAKNSTYFSIM